MHSLRIVPILKLIHRSGILPLVFSFGVVLLSFLGSLLLSSLYSLLVVALWFECVNVYLYMVFVPLINR